MRKHPDIPQRHELMNPVLQALRALGGSGSVQEIGQRVSDILGLPDEVVNTPHDPEKSSATELEYRLAWARTYLKKYGVLENSKRGIWAIVPDKTNITEVDPQDVIRAYQEDMRATRAKREAVLESGESGDETQTSWRTQLHGILTKQLSSDAFERLVKRVLRESGFVQVEVTGQSGDGGIDGRGIVKVGGLLSFYVLFQCKRYSGAVGAAAIRDFRGALVGRADKGLFVTTGSFTRDAIVEATRDGAPPIDLIDGDQLIDKLKDLGLGVKTEMVEIVQVDEEWFLKF